MRTKEKWTGLLLVILSAILYGTLPLGIYGGHLLGLSTEQVVSYRFICSFCCLLLWFVLKRERIPLKAGWKLMLIGGVGYGLTAMLLSRAYDSLGTAPATILHFIYPSLVMLLEWKVQKRKFSRLEMLSLSLVLLALALLIEFPFRLNGLGVIEALLSAVTYAVYLFYVGSKSIPIQDALMRTFLVVAGGSLFFMLRYGILSPQVFQVEIKPLFFLIGLAFLQTLLPAFFLILGLRKIRPSQAGIIGALEPLTALVIAAFVFGESLFSKKGISGLLILASVILVSKLQDKEMAPAPAENRLNKNDLQSP